MNNRKIRDIFRLLGALCFSPLYLPHLFVYGLTFLNKDRGAIIISDIKRMMVQININLPPSISLLYLLHNNSYYRSMFYHRIGPVMSLLIGWYRPGNKFFSISFSTKIGKGMKFAHPYSTIINAKSIGDNFSCLHCTTIGAKSNGRPIIGNNVHVACNVCIIGGINIGNNVTIGAGSVVVKDVPDNCVVAGNPARIIRSIE